jgi:glycosyltransferase involved in cell wall biosynthesis
MLWAGMIRAKNEARWIEAVVRSLLPLCDRVYVMDDHSTDSTVEICGRYMRVSVLPSPFDENDFSETRDKTWLLDWIANDAPYTHVACIDGDEELEPEGPQKLRNLFRRGKVKSAMGRVVYLWDEKNQWRTDGIYGNFHRPSFFEINRDDPHAMSFHSLYGNKTSLHCTNVPFGLIRDSVPTDINLLHYGYMHREDRLRKYEYYSTLKDPGNEIEDYYRHMVIGDVYPPDSRFLHAGPLALEPLTTLIR